MLKNYLLIAFRHLAKQKKLAFINIFGLSVGIACFSLFMLYAVNELNFDNFHANEKNIYRVYQWNEAVGANPASAMPYHPMLLGPAMKQDLPGIENYVRFLDNWGTSFIKTTDGVFRDNVSFADPCFFNVFSFKLKFGDPATALQNLESIVVTETEAKKLFGSTNAIGKTISIKEDSTFKPFTVTAIAEDIPSNSTIQFNILGNFEYWTTTKDGRRGRRNWNQVSYQTYVQLKPGSTLEIDKKLPAAFRKKYYPDEDKEARNNGYIGKGPSSWYGLQPLKDMHTNIFIDGAAVDPKSIWMLLSIAGAILLIACINFTTLSIGRSAGRSKEVGVRKVVGGTRKSLAGQFLVESFFVSAISSAIAFVLAGSLLPFFNQLSGRELHFSLAQFPQLVWLTLGLVALVGILAGIYPAFILSGFRPIEVLKAKIKVGGSNLFTKALVTVQFVLSAGLIISTIIILQQLHYLKSKDPGFDKDNIVDVDASGISNTKNLYARLRQTLSANPEITGITSADAGLGEGTGSNQMAYHYNGKDKLVYEYFVDPDYLHTLGLRLIAGRNFSRAIASDTVSSVIINEAMLHDLGWSAESAIGRKISGYYENAVDDPRTPVVIGVCKNFNYLDLRQQIQPQMFDQFPYFQPKHFLVRIRPGDPSEAINAMVLAWKKIAPDYPFEYSFLDESLDRFYKSEERWSNIVGWAGGISIFLACLGLVGLAALAVVNRTKEIGIRKVLGASVSTIIGLLSKDFFKLVLIALIIATPLAWYFMNKWLLDYPYRINIKWWVFAITGAATIIMALLVVSFQAIKAAVANPVKSLRTE